MQERSTAQTVALLFGAVFLVTGIAGFIPGITTHYGDLSFAGHGSGAKLLGVFQTSVLHNIVHLLFGLAGIGMAKTWEGARTYLVGGGVLYLVLFVYGLFAHGQSSANFVPVNSADNVLHVVLGVSMVAAGLAMKRAVPARRRATA